MDPHGSEVKPPRAPYLILAAGVPLVFLGIFYIYPLLAICSESFMPGGEWEPGQLGDLLGSGYYLQTLWFTFWQAALSTLLTVCVALPGAYVFARYRFPGRGLLLSLSAVPFVLPTVVTAAAFSALLGTNGVVNALLMRSMSLSSPPVKLEHTVTFILMAHVFYNYTVVLRIVGSAWSRLQPRFAEAARTLGASPLQAFMKVSLPLLAPSIVAASLLVFIFCFSSFGVILILGGPRYATIEVAIYRQAVHFFNLPMAAALSLIQIVFMLVFMWAYTAIQRKTSRKLYPESFRMIERKPVTFWQKAAVWGNVSFMVIFLASPLMALVIQSLNTGEGVSLLFYRALFENTSQSAFYIPPIAAAAYSLGIALIAMAMALVVGLLASIFLAQSRGVLEALLDPLFMLPLATSAVTLGFGYVIALDEPPLNLRTSLMLIPLAHALVAYPFVVRCVLPVLKSIPDDLKESARVLGASPVKVWWKVIAPILRKALIVGAVFAFTVSLGEFGATVFIARPQTPTMPLAIYRFLSQPGEMNYGQAMAMSTLLMIVTAAGFLSLEKLRTGDGGRF